MKFRIRYADQIVGIFSLIAITGLVVLIFAIGSGQKWFTKKLKYYSMFESGTGLSVGMNLTYKGFNVGKIKSIMLDQQQDRVRVDFYILADYQNYVLDGSLVQLTTSPIGLGSRFEFLPGNGPGRMQENTEMYRTDSEEGIRLMTYGGNSASVQADSIGLIMDEVTELLDNLNVLLIQVTSGIDGDESNRVGELLADLSVITSNIGNVTGALANIEEALPTLLGSDLTQDIHTILSNLTGVLSGAESLVGGVDNLVNGAGPQLNGLATQLSGLVKELDIALIQLQDVLAGVKNNPLIRSGVPDRSKSIPSTPHMRSGDF